MGAVIQFARPQETQQESQQGKKMQEGFIAIPNSVLRAAKGRLKGLHLLALLAVIEKTAGYNKERDEISNSQIAKEWDCSRERVGKAISEMVEAGILISHGYGRYGQILSIANPEKWGEITCDKKPQEVRQKVTEGVTKSRKVRDKKSHSINNYQQTVNTPLPPEGEVAAATVGSASKKQRPAKPEIPFEAVMQAYRESLPELSQPDLLTETRKRTIAARWKELLGTTDPMGRVRYSGTEDGLAWWSRLFAKVRMNSHWMGANDRGWAADFDWIMGPKNFVKVLEWRPVEVKQ